MFKSLHSFFKNDTRESKNLKWLITLIIFIGLVFLVIFIVPWKETWLVLKKSDLKLIVIGLMLAFPYQLLTTWSYYIVAKKQNASIGFWLILKTNFIMNFYDIVLPSTFFVSGLRWYRYNQYSNNPANTLTSIAYLKAFNLLLTIILSAGLLLFFDTTSIQGYALGIAALVIGCAFLLYFTPIICKRILFILDQHSRPGSGPAKDKIFLKYFRKILVAFTEFQNLNFKTQLVLIAMGILGQLILYTQYTVFADSVGIKLTFAQLGVMRATLLLVANLPINFSIGISLRDVSLVSLLVIIGVAMDKAVAMSVVVLAKTYTYGIIGLVLEAIEIIKKRIVSRSN